jgi:hypothetical protein
MRQLLGAGTPKELAARGAKPLWLLDPALGLLVPLFLPPAACPEPHFFNGLLTPATAARSAKAASDVRCTIFGRATDSWMQTHGNAPCK